MRRQSCHLQTEIKVYAHSAAELEQCAVDLCTLTCNERPNEAQAAPHRAPRDVSRLCTVDVSIVSKSSRDVSILFHVEFQLFQIPHVMFNCFRSTPAKKQNQGDKVPH